MSRFILCGHTRKCGWRGTWDDLIQVPETIVAGIESTRGTCPKCGGIAFYRCDKDGKKLTREEASK